MNYEQNFYQARPARAADFRRTARQALKGFWWMAALVTLIAAILGGVTLSGGSVSVGGSGFNANIGGYEEDVDYTDPDYEAEEEIVETEPILTPEQSEALEKAIADLDFEAMGEVFMDEYPIVGFILTFFVVFVIGVTVLLFLVNLFLSSPIKVGYRKFCLNVLDGREDGITPGTLFEYFTHDYFKTIGLNFCHTLIMELTMLPMIICTLIGGASFVASIPAMLSGSAIAAASGFLAFVGLTFLGAMISVCISIPVSYAYSMAHLIMADYPGVGAIEALRLSRQMMRGNKFRLFCLDFSFIGWELLAACCTCGIGYYFLTPYQHVSHAAFYEEISGRKTSEDVEFPSIDPNDYIVE